MNGFVSKPVDARTLLRNLESALSPEKITPPI